MLGLPWNWFGVVRKISFDQDFIDDSSGGDEGNFAVSSTRTFECHVKHFAWE
jgi:hypothetical protein